MSPNDPAQPDPAPLDAPSLNDTFGIPGVLTFAPANGGLLAAHVSTPTAEATVYAQGAHLTHWQPAGCSPVLFLSQRSPYTAGKAIRGGVPVIFPWFGDRDGDRKPDDRRQPARSDGYPGPAHGFARISGWRLAFAGLSGEALHLFWALEPTGLTRSLGYDRFTAGYRMSIGRTLSLELTVANLAPSAPLLFEEAFHTYFAVADARQVTIEGLAHTEYIDKADNLQRKLQHEALLRLTGRTDRVYSNTTGPCVLHDPAGRRRIVIAKSGSHSTVVWNPWQQLTATMSDMAPGDWLHMACIESANVGDNALALAPGHTHTMRVDISVEAHE